MTLVDTNILLDLATNDPIWVDWSIAQLEAASLLGPLLINDVIHAELALRYERIELLDEFVSEAGLQMVAMPRSALFLAEKLSSNTGWPAAAGAGSCLTSSLALRLPYRICRC